PCKAVKPKVEQERLIPHWPCQSCKTGTLRFIGVMNLDEATNKIARTS
ncbi:IS91 family transposase, partial [Pseudoalteromonas fuliginea]